MPLKNQHKSCRAIEPLLADYLDGNPDQPLRAAVEKHLENCPTCRESVRMQQEWLKLRPLVEIKDEDRIIPEGMNSRIVSAIRYEAAASKYSETPRRKNWRQPAFWYKAASAAAAVILLVAFFQIIQNFGSQNATRDTKSAVDQLASDFGSENATAGPTANAGSSDAVTGKTSLEGIAGSWQIYSGSFAELPAAECLFDVKATTAGSVPSTDTANQPETMIFDLLNGAEDLRILTGVENTQNTLILAAYNSADISAKAEQIKIALATCINPVRIEIIKPEDMPELLNSLGPDLYAKVFDQALPSSSWILILIGE